MEEQRERGGREEERGGIKGLAVVPGTTGRPLTQTFPAQHIRPQVLISGSLLLPRFSYLHWYQLFDPHKPWHHLSLSLSHTILTPWLDAGEVGTLPHQALPSAVHCGAPQKPKFLLNEQMSAFVL